MTRVAFAENQAAEFALRALLYQKLGVRHPSVRAWFFDQRNQWIARAEFWSGQAEHYARYER